MADDVALGESDERIDPPPVDFGEALASASAATPGIRDYDPRPAQDRARSIITGALLGITATVVVGAFVMSSWALGRDASLEDNRKTILAVLNVVFGPLIALLGSVIGFYFGSGSAQSRR